ncbi:MAG: TonB-dependent receptor [Bacteroidales bacterium]
MKQTLKKLNFRVLLKIAILCTASLVSVNRVRAQDFTQTVKGRIVDQQTQSPLPGVNVIIEGSNPLVGAVTDLDGYFKLTGIRTGRVSLQVSMMGYHTQTLANLSLISGKELVLNIEMEEQVIKTEEVVIKGKKDKTQVNNEMATISARTFTIEESQRFAGARNDVSRMASNFAGVSTANDAVNDIVIRGNSPNGLLWRLEGVEIPNPNHYGGQGATGGPVSMLNNNVLSNSDFMTSAFPAEYGNAMSGVFDLRMRKGNYEKHEFTGQIGFNGFEFGAEGPFSKDSKASYLISGRYSTLELMSKMGMNFGTGTAIPKYSDLSFKVNIPTKNAGTFNLFGLGGINSIDFVNSEKDSSDTRESLYGDRHYDVYANNDMGVIGLNHTYFFDENTYSKFNLSASRISNHTIVDSVSLPDRTTYDLMRQHYIDYKIIAQFYINKKFNPRNNIRFGIEATQERYSYIDSVFLYDEGRFRNRFDENNNAWMYTAYGQYQYKPVDKLTFNFGLHYQTLGLNSNFTLEPRAGIKWNLAPKQTLSFGYGIHSKAAATYVFYQKTEIEPGVSIQTNKNLGFMKTQHFVMGYDYNITPNLHLKVETYYQDIFRSIVETSASSYSMLNASSFSWGIPDSLKNGGSGRNYGLELTLEKFLDKGFYFLLTTSLFDSKYKGSDGVLRSTAFDSKYVVNLLFGNEVEILKKTDAKFRKWLTLDTKITTAGGQRYTPIDYEQSELTNSTVYDESKAYSEKFKDYFRADVRLAFRLEGKKASQEWAFDVQNVTNTKNPLYNQYDPDKNEIVTVYQLGIFPMFQYRITF